MYLYLEVGPGIQSFRPGLTCRGIINWLIQILDSMVKGTYSSKEPVSIEYMLLEYASYKREMLLTTIFYGWEG